MDVWGQGWRTPVICLRMGKFEHGKRKNRDREEEKGRKDGGRKHKMKKKVSLTNHPRPHKGKVSKNTRKDSGEKKWKLLVVGVHLQPTSAIAI